MILTRHEVTKQITATLPDKGIGQGYDCSIIVCANPTCECNEVFLDLKLKTAADGEDDTPLGTWWVGVDIIEKTLVERGLPAELPFARKVHGLLCDEDYRLLREEYGRIKFISTENADFDTLQVDFPMEDIEQNGTMIGYHDVLPYARQLSLEINDIRYLVEDLYCVKNNCQCTESILYFVPIEVDGSPVGTDFTTYRVDYEARQWKAEESRFVKTLVVKVRTARSELEAKYPTFYDLLAKRHLQMKQLYANYLRTHALPQAPPVHAPKKVGRNDPCTCGSGKKYKKCCGA